MPNRTASLDLDQVFSSLADPSRREMVKRLGAGPATVSELARPLKMSLAAVVQHVQVLTASGLIRSDKVGRVRTCRLNIESLDIAAKWLASRQKSFWRAGLAAIDDLLDQPNSKHQTKRRE